MRFKRGTMWLPARVVSEVSDITQSSFSMSELLTLGNSTLETWVEDVARKEGDQLGLSLVPLGFAVFLANTHEPTNATGRFRGRRVKVVDIVVMQQSEVRGRVYIPA
jgi:hypothetical protein